MSELCPTCGQPMPGDGDGFDAFWERYPKKVAKPTARRAWDRLRPGETMREAIMAGLARALASGEWAHQRGRYIPHPASWLNARRWEDEGITLPVLAQPAADPPSKTLSGIARLQARKKGGPHGR